MMGRSGRVAVWLQEFSWPPQQQAEPCGENEHENCRDPEEYGVGMPQSLDILIIRARLRDIDRDPGIGTGDRIGGDNEEPPCRQFRGRYYPVEVSNTVF